MPSEPARVNVGQEHLEFPVPAFDRVVATIVVSQDRHFLVFVQPGRQGISAKYAVDCHLGTDAERYLSDDHESKLTTRRPRG
jgi:hypothetical protein